MKRHIRWMGLILVLASAQWVSAAEPVVLPVDRDNFGRTNDQRNNNGAATQLIVAHNDSIRSIAAFDLSAVTNEITAAEFRFVQLNSMDTPVDLVIAPMRQTPNNADWNEGIGARGVQGQLARPGESCYMRSRFPDVPWESAENSPVARGLGDASLWRAPIARLSGLEWVDGKTIAVPVADTAWLESIRTSDHPVVTFGLWGTGGQGIYFFGAKESGRGSELVLTLQEEE